jgi:acetyl-CoA carboxylase alpha subunit
VTERCGVIIIGTGAGGGTLTMANASRVGEHLTGRLG